MIKKIINYIIKYIVLPTCCLLLFTIICLEFPFHVFTLLTSLIMVLAINLPIGLIKIIKTLANQTIKYEKLTKEDLLKHNNLYRDILDNYSPGILSYIDNMSFNFESIVIATLLNLKQKKYITFNNNEIIKLNDLNNSQLNNTENYILNSISNRKLRLEKNKLQNNIIKDSLKSGLIQANYNVEKAIGKKIIILLSIFILLFTIVIFIDNIFSNFIFLIIISFPIGSIIYIISYYTKYNNNPLFRTTKGNEINKKLEGLKNFLKEYSLLDEKDDKSLELWEDYLIYSLIFGQNNKIEKDYLKYIILN